MSGRLSKEKNQQELLYAVKNSKYEKDIQIMLTGDGPRRNYLLKLIKKLKFTNEPIQKRYKHEYEKLMNAFQRIISTDNWPNRA